MPISDITRDEATWSKSAWVVIEALSKDSQSLKNNWCVPPEAARFLYLLTRISGALSIVEVGTSIGFSTLHMALGIAENLSESNDPSAIEKASLITIDASKERQDIAKNYFDKSGLLNLIQTETGPALDILANNQAQWQNKLDLAFIDARKDEYLQYAELLHSCLKPGGLLVADNTQSHREEMKPFIDRFMVEDRQAHSAHQRWESCELDTPNGLIIARKQSRHSGNRPILA
ncbi:MAG: class I SAM-dependent methyltransferase [Vampirovibrionales bacterium]|nr:class I SAM-dependent methyltransferase [Vampirovibrionales bacterium]